MARTDYEAAWHALADLILSRESGWGSRALAAEMTRLAAQHQVSEGLLERALRLYGGELTIAVATQEDPPNDACRHADGVAVNLDHRQSQGGPDGTNHHAELARC